MVDQVEGLLSGQTVTLGHTRMHCFVFMFLLQRRFAHPAVCQWSAYQCIQVRIVMVMHDQSASMQPRGEQAGVVCSRR